MRKRSWSCLVVPFVMAGCVTEPQDLGVGTADVTLILPAPPLGINCLNVDFYDQNDTVTHVQALLPRSGRVEVAAVHLGAYQVTAQAYPAGDCADVPASAPWGTAAPLVFILTSQGDNSLILQLVETRPVDVTAQFLESEVVVAQDQGRIGVIAATGNRVAWIVTPTPAGVGASMAPGRIVSFVDNDAPEDLPTIVDADPIRPGDISLAADGRVFWTQNQGGGQLGAIWRFTPGVGSDLIATGQRAAEVTYAASSDTVYWSAQTSIWASNGTTPNPVQISDEPGGNNITILHGDDPGYQVLWGRYDDGLIRRKGAFSPVETAAASGLLAPDDGIIGSAADDLGAYVSTYRESDGTGAIFHVATDGSNAVVQLWPAPGEPRGEPVWPIEALNGWVYFSASHQLMRVPADGSGGLEVVAHSEHGSFALSTWGGTDWIYFTDQRFGGVVWRARLPL